MFRSFHHRFPFSAVKVTAVATLTGLLVGFQALIPFLMTGRTLDLYAVLGPTLIAFWLWAGAAPLAYDLAVLALDDGCSRWRRAALVSVLSLLLAAVHGSAAFWLFAARYLLFDEVNLSAAAVVPFQVRLLQSLLEVWVLIGALAMLVLMRRGKQQQLDLLARERNLAEARWKALRLQLPPHFMLNALNAAAGEMEDDPARAADLLAELGSFLRTILSLGTTTLHRLEDELAHLQTFLEIVRFRRGDGFTATVTVAPGLGDWPVPPLILQPLVENAVKYGLDADPTRAELAISANRDGERLCLMVRDGGSGATAGAPSSGTGVGLTHTRERLATLYGESFDMNAGPVSPRGFAVRLLIPETTEEPRA